MRGVFIVKLKARCSYLCVFNNRVPRNSRHDLVSQNQLNREKCPWMRETTQKEEKKDKFSRLFLSTIMSRDFEGSSLKHSMDSAKNPGIILCWNWYTNWYLIVFLVHLLSVHCIVIISGPFILQTWDPPNQSISNNNSQKD